MRLSGSPFGFGGGIRYEPTVSVCELHPEGSALPTAGEIKVRGRKVDWTSMDGVEDEISLRERTYAFIFDSGDWTYVTNSERRARR